MQEVPGRPLKILAFWGQGWLRECFWPGFMDNPAYEVELVSGDRKMRSTHTANIGRLWSLLRRLKRGEFDLIVCGVNEEDAWPLNRRLPARCKVAYRYLVHRRRVLDTFWAPWFRWADRGRTPMAAIDFCDESYITPSQYPLLEASTVYFKSNLYHWPHRSVAPLAHFFGHARVYAHKPKLRTSSFYVSITSTPDKVRPIRDREIDVVFTGQITPWSGKGNFEILPVRRAIYESCLRLKAKGLHNVVCIDGKVPLTEYEDLLHRSRLVVCAESLGSETSRHYDAALFGAVPFANWPYADCHQPLVPNEHAVYFSLYGNDFEESAIRALSDLDQLQKIANQARAHVLQHKFPRTVADRVVTETLAYHSSLKSQSETSVPALTR